VVRSFFLAFEGFQCHSRAASGQLLSGLTLMMALLWMSRPIAGDAVV
jgi:hypothetical protein